jgi:hypothetical protein
MPPPCAACGHQYCGKRYSIRDTHGSQGTCTEDHCCRCDGYDGCDVCERYYECCTCRKPMPLILKTLPGAWLQQTEKGTAWALSDDDVAKITGAKGHRRVILRAAAKAGCVVLRECCAATTLGDESDARRTIDEVEAATRSDLPADDERDAAVREAAAIAKDVDWDVCRLCARSLALDLGQMEDHLHNIDEDERRKSHVAASVLSRSCGVSDVEALQRLYLKLRFNAFPIDGGLAVFRDASALNHDCAPNASLSFSTDGKQLSVVLGRDLEQGEQVRISYLAPRVLMAPSKARRAALYTGFRFRCGCLRCTTDNVLDAPVVDAAAEALARGLVDDRLGRALAVLANDCLGAATPLLRADLRLLVCSRVPFRRHRLAPIAAMACWRGLHCLYAIDATASSLTGGESAGDAGRGRCRAPRARGPARPAAGARRRRCPHRLRGRLRGRGGAAVLIAVGATYLLALVTPTARRSVLPDAIAPCPNVTDCTEVLHKRASI